MSNSSAFPVPGPSLGRLRGKAAIVTGADSGIGRATARLFAHEGAKIVCVETKYFSKFFQETGFKFSWWDRELRIRLATQLLRQKGCTIDSVALAVGYADLTTFARAFKKCKGIGPQAYRRSPRCSPRPSSDGTAFG